MTEEDRALLSVASCLLEYPDRNYFAHMEEFRAALAAIDSIGAQTARLFLEEISKKGEAASQENYVAIFDHDPSASLYMTWHRYGNDRSQGKAMAALNGLYRASGYEPVSGTLPDYLPRMLEFLSVCEDWAAEVILDGFGPELAKLLDYLQELDSPHGPMLAAAIEPLRRQWPEYFLPRHGPDNTLRPMARPEPEFALMEPLRRKNNK